MSFFAYALMGRQWGRTAFWRRMLWLHVLSMLLWAVVIVVSLALLMIGTAWWLVLFGLAVAGFIWDLCGVQTAEAVMIAGRPIYDVQEDGI